MRDYLGDADCFQLVSLVGHIVMARSCMRKRFSAMTEGKKQRKLLIE